MMTKKQAVAVWREDVLPSVKEQYEQDGRPDRVARSESWNDWIDMMIRDRCVPRSAGDWTHPRECG